MKPIFILILLLPFILKAQFSNEKVNLPREQIQGIHSVTITTLAGKMNHRIAKAIRKNQLEEKALWPEEFGSPDTVAISILQLNGTGQVITSTYHTLFDHKQYTFRSYNRYDSSGNLCSRVTYDDNELWDSLVIYSRYPVYKDCSFRLGYRVDHERYGDSLLIERNIHDKDTAIHKHLNPVPLGYTPVDQDMPAFRYSRKDSINRGNTDSIIYYNQQEQMIVILVNTFNARKQVIRRDFYNHSLKNTFIYRMRYNKFESLVLPLPLNPNGKLSYSLVYRYDKNGRPWEIIHLPSRRWMGSWSIRYVYSQDPKSP